MKIVQLVTRRQRRGAEVLAALLSDGLAARNHDVVLVGVYPPGVATLQASAARNADLATSSTLKLSPGRIRELAALLADARPDIVQANGSDTLKYAVFARFMRRASWPLIYRNISVASHWLRSPAHRVWMHWLFRQVDHVAAISERSRLDLEQTYGIPSDRISTIPNAVPIPATIDRLQARRYLAREARVAADQLLINVASFSPEKNHAALIEAFERVRKERDVALILVGDGPLRAACEDMVSRKGLESAVRFLGTRADAVELMAGADLALLSSRIEGVPGVILEAAAYGVPSVATDVGAVREAIDEGVTGVLVPPGDAARFAAAVASILADDERRVRMGDAARALVRQRFNLSTVVADFDELYHRLTVHEIATAR